MYIFSNVVIRQYGNELSVLDKHKWKSDAFICVMYFSVVFAMGNFVL